jgi:hypothetical protein
MNGNAHLQGEIIATECKYTEIFFKNLVLKNQQANFNQTWYKSSLVQNHSNKRLRPLHRRDNHKNAKIKCCHLKILPENLRFK